MMNAGNHLLKLNFLLLAYQVGRRYHYEISQFFSNSIQLIRLEN